MCGQVLQVCWPSKPTSAAQQWNNHALLDSTEEAGCEFAWECRWQTCIGATPCLWPKQPHMGSPDFKLFSSFWFVCPWPSVQWRVIHDQQRKDWILSGGSPNSQLEVISNHSRKKDDSNVATGMSHSVVSSLSGLNLYVVSICNPETRGPKDYCLLPQVNSLIGRRQGGLHLSTPKRQPPRFPRNYLTKTLSEIGWT